MGIVYEILCWTTGLRYIGKTTLSLNKRLSQHKSAKGKLECSSKLVLEHGNYEIYELEKVNDESLLRKREIYYIQHTDCVNIRTEFVDRKEYLKNYFQTKYKEANKERSRINREKKKNLKNRQLLNTAVPSL
jgi:predicted GIY-YIG superfamily endonuclease